MSIGISDRLLKKVIENSVELTAHYADVVIGSNHRSTDISLMSTPLTHLETISKGWGEDLLPRVAKAIEDVNDSDDIDFHLKREKSNYDEFIDNIKVMLKVSNKAKSLQECGFKLKVIFETQLGERYWLYKGGVPYLVKGVTYFPKDGYREYAELKVTLKQNSASTTRELSISFGTDDMRQHKRDIYEMLKGKGYIFETEELYKQYRLDEADYLDKRTWQNEQVVYKGNKYINDNLHYERGNKDKLYHSMMSDFNSNDTLTEVPTNFIVHCFDLSKHEFTWLDTRKVERYVYNPDIGKKLILPDEHKNLINILLSENISAIGSDIIAGKGMGTLILTKGKAGLGKTATAEIYSETKKLPLYSVHSGQLGIDGVTLEKNLKEIFGRTQRWGCILLLDEADVYIRRRGDDIQHNAIVATFLRTMEYFKGTMFMTTNRNKDVDEAIESRCIAVLSYATPSGTMSKRLWELFIGQYELDVSKDTLKEIANKMTKLSGRDIKNICMLVSRYSQGMEIAKPDFEVFKLCATFRGKYEIGKEH